MEEHKVLIAVVFITAASSLTLSDSMGGSKSTTKLLLIRYVIPEKVKNATQGV